MIYLIITSCINDRFYVQDSEHRKNRYIDCIRSNRLLIGDDVDIKPIVVENNGNTSSYLDGLGCDVVYTDNNKHPFYYKAMNELLDIKDIIQKYNIQDDDIVIKITGRYKLLDTSFFNTVKANCDKYDAFVKFYNVSALQYMHNDCVLGLFAIKCKYLKTFEYTEEDPKSPEVQFAEYVRENVPNIMEIQNLGMECCFACNLSILVV